MIIDTLNQVWTDLLAFSGIFVTPDWGGLIVMLPVFLVIGLVGPILMLLALAWVVYAIRKPHPKVAFADPRRAAPLDGAGNPVFPTGEPYSPGEQMIYEAGLTRSPAGDALVVACPKCSLVRPATEDTCGNCGLTFHLKPTTRSLRPAGPPSGGAAAA